MTETTGGVTITYSYDANGSLIMRAGGGEDASYDWDLRGRMTGATVTKAGTTTNASYRYTADGIRGRVTEGGVTTRYVVDALSPSGYAQVIEEWTDSGLVASFVYGPGLDPISQWRQGQGSNLYLPDGHSGVRQGVDPVTGAVLLVQRFDAFGQTVAKAGTLVNTIGYRGERFDATLGWNYLRARFYDPASGRFTKMDPFAGNYTDPLQVMRYGYAGMDPVRNSDPSGMLLGYAGISIGSLFRGIGITGSVTAIAAAAGAVRGFTSAVVSATSSQ